MIDLIAYKKRMHINGEDKDKYSLRINPKGRLDFDKMCALIAERTTLTDYEVKFALAEVMQVIIENIEIGRGTELGPLGSIELSVKADAVDTEEELKCRQPEQKYQERKLQCAQAFRPNPTFQAMRR